MSKRLTPTVIVLMYAVFAGLWILFSDSVLLHLFRDPSQLALASILKGWFFVAITSVLLYVLLKNWHQTQIDQSDVQDIENTTLQTPRLLLNFIALALVVPLLGAVFVKIQTPQIEHETLKNLQAVASLKAEQIENWLDEQQGDTKLLKTSTVLNAQLFQVILGKADAQQTHEILSRFQTLIDDEGYNSIMLINNQGQLLLGQGDDLDPLPVERNLASLVIKNKKVQRGQLFRSKAGHTYMDWAVPVIVSNAQGEHAVAALLLRVIADQFLYTVIQTWPTASSSAETLLVRRDGDSVVFLNELRHRHNTALSMKLTATSTTLPAAVAVNANQPGTVKGRDYRGVEVLAAYRPIVGTDWHIVAKIDQEEVLVPLWHSLYWIGLIAFFAISAIMLALLLFLKQQRKIQYMAMRALKSKDDRLIATLADNSSDAIYVKDLDGHYLFVNHEMARILGQTSEQILRGDDTTIFSPAEVEMIHANDGRVIAENQISTHEEMLVTVDGERTYLATKGPMRDGDGHVVGLFGISRDITERKQEEDALKRSEERLHLVLRGSRDAPWDWNLETGDLYYSPRWWAMLGYEVDELPTGASLWEHIVHPDDRLRVNRTFDQVIKTDSDTYEIEFRLQHKDGYYVPVLSRGFILRDADGKPVRVSGTNTDLTERKQTEAKILRLSQLYAAISHCSQAIVHCASEESLFPQICKDVVTFGGMQMAWIGLLDEASQQVTPFASYGDHSGYLADIKVTVDASSPLGQGPTGTAIRENKPVWNQDFANDPRTAVWRDRGVKAGWASSASLPLLRNGLVVGAFTLYAKEVNAFDEDIRKLLIAMSTDISFALDNYARETERRQAEVKLHLAANVFTHAREGIMITTADGTIIEVNEAFSRITGYSREETLGHNPRILSSGRQGREFYVGMWGDLIEKGYWYGEAWNRHKNGDVYAVMQTISAVQDAQGKTQQYVALFSDITTLKEHEKQLEHIAHFDQLTGLPNRVLLADRLRQGMTQAQRRNQKLAVVFLDLDAFKAVNDTHGHAIGDQLLQTVANRMKLSLREGDTLARIGGDEFVAVLLDLDDTDASEPMLNRLLSAASQPVQINNLVLQVTASLGVTFYPQIDDVDADQLLRQADQAMYLAKQEGKNRYQVFDAEQDRNVRGHIENLDRIRRALADQEFVLYYQPKVNMRSGAVVGAEALIRWQHPQKGLLPPVVFLPLIEDHPLAIELGEWVIDTALKQIRTWQAAGLHIPVSVNIGALQLQQIDFVDRLRAILAMHPNVRASDLELEILETSALQDIAQITKVINECKALGVGFALDDFGTGYSSLTYLKQLPVGLLKIDQSFVRDMLDDSDDLAILEGIISLATAFHRDVIAEGVETIEHGAVLLQLGCELAQGYGIARPMPANDFPAWTDSWKPDSAWIGQAVVKRDDLFLLYAATDHRAWVAGTEAYLIGARDVQPPIDYHQCNFGKWLDDQRLGDRGRLAVFKDIELVHKQIHVLAEHMLELKAMGRGSEAIEQMNAFHGLRDDLLQKLNLLTHQS